MKNRFKLIDSLYESLTEKYYSKPRPIYKAKKKSRAKAKAARKARKKNRR